MGVKRPLRPEIASQYGQELAAAEKAAKMGFDPKTKKLDPRIYGPTDVKFNPVTDLKTMSENLPTLPNLQESQMQENHVKNALEAVQEEDPGFPMPSSEEEESASENQEISEEQSDIPADPEEKLQWVANELAKINKNAPGVEVLRKWKAMHGNIFILNIDDYIFIYRYLKRQEWSQLQANEAFISQRPDQQEDYVAERCTLWPQFDVTTKGALPAGAAAMLAEQIRIQSMFLDPVQVANITIKL